jgi:hypothetical protein
MRDGLLGDSNFGHAYERRNRVVCIRPPLDDFDHPPLGRKNPRQCAGALAEQTTGVFIHLRSGDFDCPPCRQRPAAAAFRFACFAFALSATTTR